MGSSGHIYRASQVGDASALRQGEILSDVVRIHIDLATLGTSALAIKEARHEFAIVFTQDCDLEQDFNVRMASQQPDKLIPNVLFCNLVTAVTLRGTTGIVSEIWKRINQNKEERYHFLQAVDKSCDAQQSGLPEMGVDFKRYFTMPTDEVYQRITQGAIKRRCFLNSPYLEHLSSRFAYFLSRVALPENHFSDPVSIAPN